MKRAEALHGSGKWKVLPKKWCKKENKLYTYLFMQSRFLSTRTREKTSKARDSLR